MLKAGALLYAIFVTLVVALLTMGILWGHYYGSIQISQSIKHSQLLANVNSAINKVLVFPDSLAYNRDVEFMPFGNETPVVLNKRQWGMYDVLVAKAGIPQDSIKRALLVGQNAFDSDSLALYVSDQDKQVYISGGILIKGKCKVPKGQFKYAYIASNNLSAKQVFPSNMDKSSIDLPKVNEKQLRYNYQILSQGAQNMGRLVDLVSFLQDKDTVDVSFFEPTLVLTTTEAYALRNKVLSGNIIIVSSALFAIEPSARLNKILVYAPYIRLEDKASGSMQLFASDSLHIGSDCNLTFPSIACALSNNVSFIEFGKGSKICGNVLQYQIDAPQSKSILKISSGVEIEGLVYTNAYVQASGKIKGSLYANQLYLKTDAGYYENHLMDTEIDFSQLSRLYVSGNLFANKKQRIVSWEY